MNKLDKQEMEELREEVGVKEFQEEDGEEIVKVGWTRGANGMEEKNKTETDLVGLCENRFGGSGSGVENDSKLVKL